jgi:hypothetical protein
MTEHGPSDYDPWAFEKVLAAALRSQELPHLMPPDNQAPAPQSARDTSMSNSTDPRPRSYSRGRMPAWELLAHRSDADLARLDVALVNLACTENLASPAPIDVPTCVRRLNAWAGYVHEFTRRLTPHFRAQPHEYHHSEGYFRVLCLVTALQRDLGLRYNPAKTGEHAPLDTADCFIHGAVLGEGGTCATMPVVDAAVSRRLGYPLKLVEAKGHVFATWDAPGGERFNIEATNQGLTVEPDDYYCTGRYAITPQEAEQGRFLKSLTPRQELAHFLGQRGLCWLDAGNRRKAAESFVWAFALYPQNRLLWNTICRVMDEWHRELQARMPPRFPGIRFQKGCPRRFPSSIPMDVETDFAYLDVVDNLLNDAPLDHCWWQPLRQGKTLRSTAHALVMPLRSRVSYLFDQTLNEGARHV